MLLVNLWGAPGAGKSTTAAAVFSMLKQRGCRAEIVTEYAKELVWSGRRDDLVDQASILGEQNRRQLRLARSGCVDVAITDSPLPLVVFYRDWGHRLPNLPESFARYAMDQFAAYRNLNYFLRRGPWSFDGGGRIHGEDEAERIETALLAFMESHRLPYTLASPGQTTHEALVRDVLARLAEPGAP